MLLYVATMSKGFGEFVEIWSVVEGFMFERGGVGEAGMVSLRFLFVKIERTRRR